MSGAPIEALDLAALENAAAKAVADRNDRAMIDLGGEFERRSLFGTAWSLMARGVEVRAPSPSALWQGQPISDQTLLVRRRMRHLGAELRMSRFVARAQKLSGSLIHRTHPFAQRGQPLHMTGEIDRD